MAKFAAGKVRARKYRNRRIGEFFKEIDLSEKQSTGISKILRELRLNGSPLPEFETDTDRTYLIATIRIKEGFYNKHVMYESKSESDKDRSESYKDRSESYKDRLEKILVFLEDNDYITGTMASELLGVHIKTVQRVLKN